jgi:hypothetical protein
MFCCAAAWAEACEPYWVVLLPCDEDVPLVRVTPDE